MTKLPVIRALDVRVHIRFSVECVNELRMLGLESVDLQTGLNLLCSDVQNGLFLWLYKSKCAEIKMSVKYPASILRKSTSGRYRPVSYPDGPMTARYRFT